VDVNSIGRHGPARLSSKTCTATEVNVDSRYLEISVRSIDVLEDAYSDLRRSQFPDDPAGRRMAVVNAAVGRMAAAGVRQLKAARGDIDAGWEPESVIHMRAALEAALDVAFLLSHAGEEREALARQYAEIGWLRISILRNGIKEEPGRISADKREEWEKREREFGDSKGSDPRRHWTGENRGEVRRVAFKYLRENMPQHVGDLSTIAKDRIFDQIASPMVHADPAALLFVPRDENGWPLIRTQAAKLVHTLSLCIVSLMLLWGVTRRASRQREEAEQLLHEAHRLVEGIA
jgi:hypothetical protein